jgi:hypothetical protein
MAKKARRKKGYVLECAAGKKTQDKILRYCKYKMSKNVQDERRGRIGGINGRVAGTVKRTIAWRSVTRSRRKEIS